MPFRQGHCAPSASVPVGSLLADMQQLVTQFGAVQSIDGPACTCCITIVHKPHTLALASLLIWQNLDAVDGTVWRKFLIQKQSISICWQVLDIQTARGAGNLGARAGSDIAIDTNTAAICGQGLGRQVLAEVGVQAQAETICCSRRSQASEVQHAGGAGQSIGEVIAELRERGRAAVEAGM